MQITLKHKRSFTYSLVMLVVLTIFLLGYFFYFVPGNRDTVHKNGFLILRTIASNVEDKSSGRLNFFVNIFRNSANNDSLLKLLKDNRIDASFEYVEDTVSIPDELIAREKEEKKDSISGLISITNENFIFSIRNRYSGQGIDFIEKASSFLGQILVTQKDELFKSYALGLVNGESSEIIYHDRELGLRSDIRLDSLLPGNIQGYMEGIREISFHNYNQKMFYSPFKVDTIQLVIFGFASTQQYHATIRKVPLKFMYPLAIAFLLLLVFMPILKFYVMDSNEHVSIKDLAWFALSVFVGASVLTLVLIQYLLWQGEEVRVSDNLGKLSAQIEQSFSDELRISYNQLCIIDSLREQDTSIDTVNKEVLVDYSARMRDFIRSSNKKSDNFYHFERVSWVDSAGRQLIKAEMGGPPVFTNVKERGYFKAFENNTPFFFRDSSSLKPFGWEPIYSWTNADFNICISKPSRSDFVSVLATKMYSVFGSLVPKGYGFCIIDADGNVMLHSETNRNLRENLFDKAEPSTKLIGSVAARQDAYLNDINIYGKWHMMYVHRLDALPYTLVTFYDKGYIMPVNMRILIFGLLFCFLSAISCTILWLILSPVQLNKYPFIYCRLDGVSWVTPNKKEAEYYLHSIFFLMAYVFMFVCFVGLYDSLSISNFTIFALVLFTPVNVICSLFSIRAAFTLSRRESDKRGEQRLKRKALAIAIVHLLFSCMFYAYSKDAEHPINDLFVCFQVLFNLWMWYYILSKRNAKAVSVPVTIPQSSNFFKQKFIALREKIQNYLVAYNVMVILLIISLSVLPSAFYTWYAHNQEIVQTLKKQHLHFAAGIDKRWSSLRTMAGFEDTGLIPDHYLKGLLEKKGIYTIYDDVLKWDTLTGSQHNLSSANNASNARSFERFYFSIAEQVSNSYYDAQLYPALEDYAKDGSWNWKVSDSLLQFTYNGKLSLRDVGSRREQVLQISSTMPSRFMFLNAGVRGILLCLFVLLLLYGLYKWLWVNTQNLFLLKFIQTADPGDKEKKRGLVAEAYDRGLINYAGEAEEFYYCSDYKAYSNNQEEKDLQEREKKILEVVRKGKPFYEFIWNACTEKERYLIDNFADSGLINYKNTNEIYGLISKGVLKVSDGKLKLFSPGFRAYIMTNSDTAEVTDLRRKHDQNSTWQALRRPFTLLLLCSASLVFFTQEAMFQKILALAGGIGSLLTMIPKISSFGSGKSSE